MRRKRAPSKATRLALISLLSAPDGMHGYEIMQTAGIRPGTLYPMLARLEDQGLLSSRWEEPRTDGRPPRHIYSLTQAGCAFAKSFSETETAVPDRKLKPGSV